MSSWRRNLATALPLGLSLAAWASPAAAQEIAGTLRQEFTNAPAIGALITVSLAANDSVIARTTTDERGVFLVPVGTDSVIVRALRIGQEPVLLARVAVYRGERYALDADLPDRPVELMAIDTRVNRRCLHDPVNGRLVARLFNDARTALWASSAAAESREAIAVFRQVEQRYTTRDQPAGKPFVRQDTLASLQPFRANDVTRLLRRGFREVRPDKSMIYSAPDADLLTDDRFLSEYCLRLAQPSINDSTVVGVTFEPAGDDRIGVVRVRGTLWLDERSNELRRIEYGYRGLEPELARAAPGGVVEYTRLDNGVWFVSDWRIRMPRVLHVANTKWRGQELLDPILSGVQITSGHVVELHEGAALRYSSGESTAPGAANAFVDVILATRDSTHCETVGVDPLVTLTGVLRDSVGAPVAGVPIRVRWTESVRVGPPGGRYIDTVHHFLAYTAADGSYVLCDLPRYEKLRLVAGSIERPLARTTLVFRQETVQARVELTALRVSVRHIEMR